MHMLIGFSGVLAYGLHQGYASTVSGLLDVPANIFSEHMASKEPELRQMCRGRIGEAEFFADVAQSWNKTHPERAKLRGYKLREAYYDCARLPTLSMLDMFERVMYHPERPGQTGCVHREMPPICIVEDCSAEIRPMLPIWHMDATWMADRWIFSSQAGSLKEDPGFFRFVMNELGGRPDEYLYIDSREEYLREAERYGIQTILYNVAAGPEWLEKELADCGFVFAGRETA